MMSSGLKEVAVAQNPKGKTIKKPKFLLSQARTSVYDCATIFRFCEVIRILGCGEDASNGINHLFHPKLLLSIQGGLASRM